MSDDDADLELELDDLFERRIAALEDLVARLEERLEHSGTGIARRIAGLEDLAARLEGRIRGLELEGGDPPAPPIDRLEHHLQEDQRERAAELAEGNPPAAASAASSSEETTAADQEREP